MSSNILCNQLTVRDTLKNVTLDNVTITSLQLDSASATDGYVLTSDGSGNATWEALPVGGAPTFGNGTEALPSITFASDTGTGIYRPSAGTMGLVSAGSSVATVSAGGITVAGGKVSSGTLQVVDDAVTGYVLTSGDNNGNATWSGQILLPDGTFSNPSYGFVNHAGCGMFCDSNTKLSLTVANDPMLEITDGGVGIGGDGTFSGTVTCSSVEASNGASGAPSHSFTNFPKNGMFSTSLTTLTLTVNDTDTMELYDNGDGIAVDGNVDVGGRLLVLDGSAAEPSITFSNDDNTGLYRDGLDAVGISAGGTNRLTVNTTGAAVNGDLSAAHVVMTPGGDAATPSITFYSDLNTGIYPVAPDSIGFSAGGTNRLSIDTAGATVSGTGRLFVPDGSAAVPSITFSDDVNTGIYRIADETVGISTNGTNRLTVDATGATVSGKTVTTTFQMTTGASNGYVLKSDGSGNATWTAPSDNVLTNLDFGDNSGSAITASADGSLSHGDTTGTSSIVASGVGSHAHAVTTLSSIVTASGKGSHAHGSTTSTSTMTASGEGSRVQGIAYNGGVLEASSFGSDACGSADGSGSEVKATLHTACARGQATSGGKIRAAGRAAFSFGRAMASGTTVYADGANSVVFAQATASSSTVSATGENAFIVGRNSFASASMQATGVASAIIGVVDTAGNMLNAADASLSVGRSTTLSAANDYSILLGQYGTSLTTADTLPIGTDTGCLQIAGGTSGSPDISVVIGTDTPGTGSTGKGYANAWETSGADYAEFFEWEDGNVDEQDRIGYFVKLTGDGKIVKANATDALDSNVLGIVTSTQSHTAFIADGHAMKWCGIAMRDDFGRTLTELNYKQPALEVLYAHYRSLGEPDDAPQVPPQELIDSIEAKEETDATIIDLLDESLRDQVVPIRQIRANPAYDRDATYIRRNDRPEWDPISLLGKVYVRDDGTCVVGQKCTCNADGVATPGTDWFVMERKSANVIRVFFR